MTKTAQSAPVLILGGGVHGAAIALELILNGVPVHLVDKFDIGFGATSKSSRLIHGGLRYLEYGDFKLVRESLAARHWNLALAPQFVRPLWLHIPTSRRWSGLLRSAVGFLGLSRTSWGRGILARKSPRGFWPTRIGLWMYDCLTRFEGSLPWSSSSSVGTPGAPRVNRQRYRWLCSYSDAQMLYPERLILALLAEVQLLAVQENVSFQVSTYVEVRYQDGRWELRDTLAKSVVTRLQPACIVNATGAWGDETLKQLGINTPPLFGGTKGTHFITWNDELRTALQGEAVYAEADDGRLVFVLPFGDGVLVGTTDETFTAQPETAAATDCELAYLLRQVNLVMDCQLTRDDITLHYSGVRPLPRSHVGDNAAVSRDHACLQHVLGQCPILTLVGGKLTTWREFARQVSDCVLDQLERRRIADAATRVVLGQCDPSKVDARGHLLQFPESEPERRAWRDQQVVEFGVSPELVDSLFPLYGLRLTEILAACQGRFGTPIHGTAFTTGIVNWVVEHEWVRTLPDLVERRLMLVFARDLHRQTLIDLAQCLVTMEQLTVEEISTAVADSEMRLQHFYGRTLREASEDVSASPTGFGGER